MKYQPVIGLEIHAELLTRSKMFCACPVVDVTAALPNSAVCPVCAGMPGTLPVINKRAVEYALRVALALECQINPTSIFARKNYFYPDLPKGYQISQYEQPLARHGRLPIRSNSGESVIRIRRVHLEEDTGKSTHLLGIEDQESGIQKPQSPGPNSPKTGYSLVDLNRAGVPLLEIVTEPDMHSAEEVGAYARGLRRLLRYLRVNSGDMQKGVLRIEPNISVRLESSSTLGTRTEVKNLNSFRALERAVEFEIDRQVQILEAGGVVEQATVGWDEARQETFIQRVKEDEDDYRYFPEPDLPPLVVEKGWIEQIRASLPERPYDRFCRFKKQFGLSEYDAHVLTSDRDVADYFEQAVSQAPGVDPKTVANWISSELFGWMNETGTPIGKLQLTPAGLGELLGMVQGSEINQNTAKKVLAEMLRSGKAAAEIVQARGLRQISDDALIEGFVTAVLEEHPAQVQSYLDGKTSIANWLFGQVMRRAKGKANPQVVKKILNAKLADLKAD